MECPNQTEDTRYIFPHIEQVIKEVKPTKIWFTFDNGNEFKGKVKQLLDKYKAEIHLNDPHSIHSHNTMGIIERYNQTILNKIKKYMSATNSLEYVNVLNNLVKKYNNTIDSATDRTLKEILKQNKNPIIEIDLEDEQDDFKVGDYVRYLKKTKTFDKKGFINKYSYKVHQIIGRKGRQYKLDNNKSFYPEQLIKSKEGNSLEEIQKKHKEVNKKEKKRLDNLKEHGVEDIQQFIREGKRARKERKRYIEEI
jgi:hypothetical protein